MNDSYHIEELEIRISNYLSGNCTEEEKEALFAYLASNEDAAKIFREMSAVWAVSSVPAFAKVEDANLSQKILRKYIRMRILLMKLKCQLVRGRILCFPMEQRFH